MMLYPGELLLHLRCVRGASLFPLAGARIHRGDCGDVSKKKRRLHAGIQRISPPISIAID